MTSRSSILTLSLAGTLLLGGCLTVGGGYTERQWNDAIARFAPGLTQAELLNMMGEPRERLPAEPDANIDETWIYSRPEKEGTRPTMTGEHDILLPNGRDVLSVPDYEDTDIIVIAEYHLHWRDGELVSWERVVDRSPGR